eukprot:Phypoly_transcript_12628.p1 GENE.Phypoly_transcript_12628~~Phypoly_transcript_12628.p1  ORF type:complete len:252 (+),score=17.22 Phypoly_transcript_12628:19-774(+)
MMFALLLLCCTAAASPLNVAFSDTKIQVIGRTYAASSGFIFAWSGVQFSFVVTGISSVSAYLSAEQERLVFDVFVDGQMHYMSVSGTSQTEYVLASGLSTSASHTITIMRANEASYGTSTFYGLGVGQGHLVTPPARPNRRIEFIGDSMTCGYGDLGVDPCMESVDVQDVYYAHGPRTSLALGADFMVTAWSGIGMVHNYGDTSAISLDALPSFYNLSVGNKNNYGTWDFTKWVPHAVVINLGMLPLYPYI